MEMEIELELEIDQENVLRRNINHTRQSAQHHAMSSHSSLSHLPYSIPLAAISTTNSLHTKPLFKPILKTFFEFSSRLSLSVPWDRLESARVKRSNTSCVGCGVGYCGVGWSVWCKGNVS